MTYIDSFAFNNCSKLTSLIVPSNVSLIGEGVFDSTPWWETYAADTNNQYGNIFYINDVAFRAVSTEITSCEFKEGTISIATAAFQECGSLESVNIPNGITSIGDNAFFMCSSLTSVNIPNSVTSIGNDAFSYCDGIASVTIPNTVTSIGMNAFCACEGLTSITIPNSVTSMGGYAFAYCSNLTSVTINALTPPALDGEDTFDGTNNCPIYVPSGSVNAYKTAEGWSTYASRIQAIPTT